MSLMLFPLKKKDVLNSEDIESLYQIFKQDFIDNTMMLTKGSTSYPIDVKVSVSCDCPFEGDKKEERFWHIITKKEDDNKKCNNPCPNAQEKNRIYCYARASRIHWIKYLIENWQDQIGHPLIKSYYQEHGTRKSRLIIWDMSKDFLIVIKKLDNILERFLITSYIVHRNRKDRYKKELKRYENNNPIGCEWFS